MKTGIELIQIERERQVNAEGWSRDHDDKHVSGELAEAAACYAAICGALVRGATVSELKDVVAEGYDSLLDWPWAKRWWKPKADPIRNLVKAGALIAAEIDRLNRKNLPPAASASSENDSVVAARKSKEFGETR